MHSYIHMYELLNKQIYIYYDQMNFVKAYLDKNKGYSLLAFFFNDHKI